MAISALKGRNVLITGAARGIGLATARAFAAHGAQVAVADIDLDSAHRAADEVSRIAPARAYRIDVRDREAFGELVQRIENGVGPVDVLVNNAGIMPIGPAKDEPDAVSRRQVDINFFGVLYGMQAVLPYMLQRRRGHIVNIASVAGKIGTPYAGVYSGTKHAVIGLTEAIRHEHRDSGVGFSYVMPALVDTELISGTGRPVWPPPLTPEQVARAVVERAVRKGRVDVYVPRISRLSAVLPAITPRRVYERVGTLFGLVDMFSHVDEGGRGAYRDRMNKE